MEDRLALHAKRIGIQDGSSRTALREWLEEITSAKEWTRASDVQTINMIGYLLKGDLDRAVRDYIREGPGRTWVEVRGFIAARFLDQDEQEYLRKKVDTLRQAAHQDVRDFSVEFDQKVKLAYTLAEREVPLVQERLIRTFVDGIASRDVRRQCHATRPQTLRDAYTAASTADRADQLAGRCEVPMEVGPVRYPVGSGPTEKVVKPDPVSQALDSVIRRLAKVEKLMTRSAEAVPRRAPPGRQQWVSPRGRQPPPHFFGKRAWNEDGTPNCFNCGRRGHIAIYCPQVGGNVPPKNASAPLPVNASGSG